MFRYWSDFDRSFTALDELRKQLESSMHHGNRRPPRAVPSWPHIDIEDNDSTLKLTAEVPGLGPEQLGIKLEADTLTIRGERKPTVPEGFSVHRQERPAVNFARSINLPTKVDPEKVAARVKDGVLTITLEKAASVQPRQISVTGAR